jgi:hypothetical protein
MERPEACVFDQTPFHQVLHGDREFDHVACGVACPE